MYEADINQEWASANDASKVINEIDRILEPVPAIGDIKQLSDGNVSFLRFYRDVLIPGDEAWQVYAILRIVNDDASLTQIQVEKISGEPDFVLKQRILQPKQQTSASIGGEEIPVPQTDDYRVQQQAYKEERKLGLDKATKEEAKDLIDWLKSISLSTE